MNKSSPAPDVDEASGDDGGAGGDEYDLLRHIESLMQDPGPTAVVGHPGADTVAQKEQSPPRQVRQKGGGAAEPGAYGGDAQVGAEVEQHQDALLWQLTILI